MVLLVLSVPCMMGASDLTESVKLEAEFQNESHPYIRAYIQERGRIADEDSILNNSEQRAYDMELMKEFYREDIKVASIIQKYQPEMKLMNITEKATSLNKENISELLDRVVAIYDTATEEEQELLFSYMGRCVDNCGSEDAVDFFYETAKNAAEQTRGLYTINVNNAVNYAITWSARNDATGYKAYNTALYPCMDTIPGNEDCTNFASQCLKAGGIPFFLDWYCNKKNNSYPYPTSTAQLNASWSLADPSPFISAQQFYNFWLSRSDHVYYTKSYYINNRADVFNSAAGRGSVAMITSGTTLYMWPVHATFITGYSGTDFLYSAHSNHRTNASLTLALQSDSNYSGVRFFMFT